MAVKDEEVVIDQDELLEQQQNQEEETENQEENPSFQFENPDDDFEIVDEDSYQPPEPEEDESSNQMQEQFQQMQQQLQMMQQMQSQPKNDNSQLAEVLKQMQENMSQNKDSDKPQVDFKKKRSEWMEQFFDKPVDILDDYTQTNIAPAFMQMQNEIKTLKQQLSRQNTASDPNFKKIMDKYGDEVDSWAKNFKDDPDAYKKAASMVGMQHFNELLEEEKKAALEEMEESKPEKKGVSYTGTERQPNPKKPRKKQTIVLKPHEKREFERQFAVSPISSRKKFYELKWVPNHKS